MTRICRSAFVLLDRRAPWASLDVGSARKFVAHLALLGAGKDAIELMANLSTVPAAGTMLIVGGPVRAYAVA